MRFASCVIAGIGQTQFARTLPDDANSLAARAVLDALQDAGLKPADVNGVIRTAADAVSELDLVRLVGVSNLHHFASIAYGGGMSLIGHAAMSIELGAADVVVCFRSMKAGAGSTAKNSLSRFEEPYGLVSQAQLYALPARRYLYEFGRTSEDFGRVAVAQRQHAQRNPAATLHDRPLSLEQHATGRLIADPLRRDDCCLISEGAVAVVLARADRAEGFQAKPIRVEGFAQATGPRPEPVYQRERLSRCDAAVAVAQRLRRDTGIRPLDVDVAAFYDHFSPYVLFCLEAYGFCAFGEGGQYVADGHTVWPLGELPTNTHGGSLSEAYMHGLNHVIEGVRQLRGTASCQVDGAEIALVASAMTPVAAGLLLRG